MTYHEQRFVFLIDREDLVYVKPNLGPGDQEPRPEVSLITIVPEIGYLNEDKDRVVLSRYIVKSRGELLLVRRYGWNRRTTRFEVLQMQELPATDEPSRARFVSLPPEDESSRPRFVWSELPNLDGRMLFLAKGCSTAYEVGDIPGLKEGIYFKSDVYVVDELLHYGPVDATLRRNLTEDCGMWSGAPPGSIATCFVNPPQIDEDRFHTPPAWLLPSPSSTSVCYGFLVAYKLLAYTFWIPSSELIVDLSAGRRH